MQFVLATSRPRRASGTFRDGDAGTIVLQLLGQSEILLVGQQADAKDIL